MSSLSSRVSMVSAVGAAVFLFGISSVDSSINNSPRADRKALQKETDLKKLNRKMNLFKNSKRSKVPVPVQYRGQGVGPDIVAWQICGGDDTSFDMS